MTTPRDDTPTRLESAAAALLRSQAAEIERLRAELGDLPEAQADMLRTIKELRAEAELFAKHVGIKLARKDALLRECGGGIGFLTGEREMNFDIDNFTLGQLKQIAALVNSQIAQPAPSSTTHPFVGKYVIARCYSAGVHSGTVVSVDGENVILKDSRRLWSWKAKDGVALSGVAQCGVQEGSKLDVVNPEIALAGVCELIPCSAAAKESIDGFKK